MTPSRSTRDPDQPDDLVVGEHARRWAASPGPRRACSRCTAGCSGRSARPAGRSRPGRTGRRALRRHCAQSRCDRVRRGSRRRPDSLAGCVAAVPAQPPLGRCSRSPSCCSPGVRLVARRVAVPPAGRPQGTNAVIARNLRRATRAGRATCWRRAAPSPAATSGAGSRATGTYDAADTVIVRYQTRDGASGVDVVDAAASPTAARRCWSTAAGWRPTNTGARRRRRPRAAAGPVTVDRLGARGRHRRQHRGRPTARPGRSPARRSAATLGRPVYGGFVDLRDREPRGGPARSRSTRPAGPRQRAALLLRPAVVVLRRARGVRLLLPRSTTSGAGRRAPPSRPGGDDRDPRRLRGRGASRRRRAASTPVTKDARGREQEGRHPAELLRARRSGAAGSPRIAPPRRARGRRSASSSSATRSVPIRPGSSAVDPHPARAELVGERLGDHRQTRPQPVRDRQVRAAARARWTRARGQRAAVAAAPGRPRGRAGRRRGTPTRRRRSTARR